MKEFVVNQRLMGSSFTLGIVAANEVFANTCLQCGIQEIQRLENLLSEFIPESITSIINHHNSKEALVIERECFELIQRSRAISVLTNGDFDITTSPFKKLYQFKNSNFVMPATELIQQTKEMVGYQKLKLNEKQDTITKTHQDLKISFAAIGKGYAADCVKKLWLKMGVESGFINASGDLCVFGYKADGSKWKIGIANPDQKDKILFYVPIQNAAAATSGDYEQYFTYQNIKYSHNINPKTGIPLKGVKSVSVFSPSAELSDALATAIYVKGTRKGIEFVNQLPNTHCIIISEENKVFLSKHLNYETALI